MAAVNFYKVVSLPGTLVANSFYYIENGTYAESYLTDDAGVAKSIGNSAMINALIAAALADWSDTMNTVEIVSNIAARDALIATLDRNAMILVIDATGDPTVGAGSALYAYANASSTTYKIAEYESMDVVVQWTSISGRPTSTPAQIDIAVSQSHTHTNKAVLDLISDSSGKLYYNGSPIGTEWTTNNW